MQYLSIYGTHTHTHTHTSVSCFGMRKEKVQGNFHRHGLFNSVSLSRLIWLGCGDVDTIILLQANHRRS